MKTPVIFIIFNRPSTTKRVFEKIKQAKPETLYLVADGPRPNNIKDKINCAKTKKIIEYIDWECNVIKDFSSINLGCKVRISSGITNAFKHFDRAIILEDDALPNPSFFKFCEELLEKYSNNTNIFSITGDNFLFSKQSIIKNQSYYFSKYPNIWGWATWKRAWDKYDITMQSWPKIKTKKIIDKSFYKQFDLAYNNKIDTWDIQWMYTCLLNKGLTIVPSKNLVSNIGFSKTNSTHTKITTIVANIKTENIDFPLIHPKKNITIPQADKISRFHFTKLGLIIDFVKHCFKIN